MSLPRTTIHTTRQPPRPNSCTYWVTDQLLAGEHPTEKHGNNVQQQQQTRAKLRLYLDCGITHFVDLTFPGERDDYQDLLQQEAAAAGISSIQYSRASIPDFGVPSENAAMTLIIDAIDETIIQNNKNKVYVHCRGGIGRTGMTVGCYLKRHGCFANNNNNMDDGDGDQALAVVNRLFQFSDRSRESYRSPETNQQEDFVRHWSSK